jgi:transposase-like protein
MSKNQIQFQIGVSLPEFISKFGTEDQCLIHLEQVKWPFGFKCDSCSSDSFGTYQSGSRKIYQCKSCRKNHRITAGTLFHRTKIPLQKWFLAIREISQSKNSLSALELHRHIDVNYKTAWLMKQKIMQMMYESDLNYKLKGRIEIDDAYLGGKLKNGKRGRGSENKSPFIAAVETNKNNNPVFIRLSPVENFTRDSVKKWALQNIELGCDTVSDGLPAFTVLKEISNHKVLVTSKAKKEDVEKTFKWVNTILSNIKTSIAGTFHSLKFERYGVRYLADLQFRLNRRFDLRKMFFGLIKKAIHSSPKTAKQLSASLTG